MTIFRLGEITEINKALPLNMEEQAFAELTFKTGQARNHRVHLAGLLSIVSPIETNTNVSVKIVRGSNLSNTLVHSEEFNLVNNQILRFSALDQTFNLSADNQLVYTLFLKANVAGSIINGFNSFFGLAEVE